MDTAGKRKRGGQSKPADEVKRHNITFRARDQLRHGLQTASVLSGRSISEEIERRLEHSLAEDAEAGGPRNKLLIHLISELLSRIEILKGSWVDNIDARAQVQVGLQAVIDNLSQLSSLLPAIPAKFEGGEEGLREAVRTSFNGAEATCRAYDAMYSVFHRALAEKKSKLSPLMKMRVDLSGAEQMALQSIIDYWTWTPEKAESSK
jgi:hypothetical protein